MRTFLKLSTIVAAFGLAACAAPVEVAAPMAKEAMSDAMATDAVPQAAPLVCDAAGNCVPAS